ncbi:hypothetical protein GNF80_09960 [Clostridium perfringens]|nr:hypothetical protein [Clostridium perfringens]
MKNLNWDLYKGKNTERGKQGFINLINRLEELDYTLESDYVNSQTIIDIKCNKGHEFSATPNNFINSKQICKMCRCKNPKPTIKKEIKIVVTKEEKVIDEKKSKVFTSINNKLTKEQLKHFEDIDKEFNLLLRPKFVGKDIEFDKSYLEITDIYPEGYNQIVGVPIKNVNLKEELRRSRNMGNICRVEELLDISFNRDVQ